MMLSQSGAAAAPPTAPEAAPVAAGAPRAGDPTSPRSDVGGAALPTDTLPASTELLSYYRQRSQEFEAERSEFIKRISEIEVSPAPVTLTCTNHRVVS